MQVIPAPGRESRFSTTGRIGLCGCSPLPSPCSVIRFMIMLPWSENAAAWRDGSSAGKLHGEKIFVLEGKTPAEMLDALFAKIPGKECTIVGMGNEKGPGRLLSHYFGEASVR